MLRYTTDRPGLITFYDIQPGNRAGLFSQPQNPHRAALRDRANILLRYTRTKAVHIKVYKR